MRTNFSTCLRYNKFKCKLDTIKLLKLAEQDINQISVDSNIFKYYQEIETLDLPFNDAIEEKMFHAYEKLIEENSKLCFKLIFKLLNEHIDNKLIGVIAKNNEIGIPIILSRYLKVEKALKYINQTDKDNEILKDIYQGFLFRSAVFTLATGVIKLDDNGEIIRCPRNEANTYMILLKRMPSYRNTNIFGDESVNSNSTYNDFYSLYLFFKQQKIKFDTLYDYYSRNKQIIDEYFENESTKNQDDNFVVKNRWIIPNKGDVYVSQY